MIANAHSIHTSDKSDANPSLGRSFAQLHVHAHTHRVGGKQEYKFISSALIFWSKRMLASLNMHYFLVLFIASISPFQPMMSIRLLYVPMLHVPMLHVPYRMSLD